MKKLYSEGIQSDTPLLTLEIEDSELVSRIDKAVESAKPLYEKVRTRAKQNRRYWLGQHLDASKLKDYEAKIVNNIIFRDMETMLPIITQNPPLPKLLSSNKPYDRSVEKIMKTRWEVHDKMLENNRKAVRGNFIDLLGCIKYRWDKDTKEIAFEYVETEHLVIDPDARDLDSVSFVAEFINNYTVAEVIKLYPDKKADLLRELGITSENDERMGAKLGFVEFNTPEFQVWKCKGVILDKQKNPNWDWGNAIKVDENGNAKAIGYNLFKKPRVPYIFFQTFNLGDMIYSNTSFIEQSVLIQDGVNKRKRQISDNADEANGVLVGSGSGISKEEFAKIDDEPNLKIWVGQGRPQDSIARITGNQLSPFVFDDMTHSEAAIDSIWGTHEITRGAGEANTATQDVLQQKQDYGRIDDIVKAYEDFNEQYFQALFQMMLVHYTEPHVYSFDDEDDLSISRDNLIREYSKTIVRNDSSGEQTEEQSGDFRPPIIMVKRGSTLPTDDTTRRNEALELAKMGRISDIDLYEKLDWANPREMAYRAFLQNSAPQQLYAELGTPSDSSSSQGALQDFEAIRQGQPMEPNPEVSNPQAAAAHIQTHNIQLDSPEFSALPPEAQQAFVNHLKAELAVAKQVASQPTPNATPQPTGGTPPPAV